VRHRGTIGGSIANNDPAADYPAAALALGATIKTDRRSIKADDFFTGMFSTALEQGELITAVEFPGAGQGRVRKVPQPGVALRDRWRVRGADLRAACASR
jgi:carbon-monoxide dehydrogenase medium subunit